MTSAKKSAEKSATKSAKKAVGKNWKDLAVEISQSLDAAHSQLGDLQSQSRLAKPHRAALKKFHVDLTKKKVLLDQVKADYETGALPQEVSDKDRILFKKLVLNLPKNPVVAVSAEPDFIAVPDHISKYTGTFFSVGPHGSGRGRPDFTKSELEVGGQGPEG